MLKSAPSLLLVAAVLAWTASTAAAKPKGHQGQAPPGSEERPQGPPPAYAYPPGYPPGYGVPMPSGGIVVLNEDQKRCGRDRRPRCVDARVPCPPCW